jgi:hypothetical protein
VRGVVVPCPGTGQVIRERVARDATQQKATPRSERKGSGSSGASGAGLGGFSPNRRNSHAGPEAGRRDARRGSEHEGEGGGKMRHGIRLKDEWKAMERFHEVRWLDLTRLDVI